MAIKDRNLSAGTRLQATYKKQAYICSVEQEGEGTAFVLEDGRRFKSPSAAGSAVMGGKAVNGWLFWSLAGEEAPVERRDDAAVQLPRAKTIYRLPNQKGIAAGKSRWFCNDCRKSFLVDAGEQPSVCPEGHARTSPESASAKEEEA